MNYQEILLNTLLNKFENSKSYIDTNKKNQKISIKISKIFPKYLDETDYYTFREINQELEYMQQKEYIYLKLHSGEMYDLAILNPLKISDIYTYLNRTPKKNIYLEISSLLEQFSNKNDVLSKYCSDLQTKLNDGTLKYTSEYVTLLNQELISIDEIFKLEKETFYRDFSIKTFGNSKVFGKISKSVANILYKYTDYPNKDTILAYFNLVNNPTYVYFKGNAILEFTTQNLDLSKLPTDIGLPITLLDDIINIHILGQKVITIENLTNFNNYPRNEDFVIYLGGFHNQVRRNFIKRVYKGNPNKEYLHFGDIDAGGFYILEHLISKTGIDFIPYKMDIQTLKEYSKFTQPLTQNDILRLNRLLNTKYHDTIYYMLEHNCKLEQEAII